MAKTKEQLIEAAERTKAEARANPSAATRQLAIEASRELSAWIVANEKPLGPGPGKGRGNLAGKRQWREHYARHNIKGGAQ